MGGYWLGGNDNLIETATLTSSSQETGIVGMAVKKAGTGSGVAYTDNPGAYTGTESLIYTVEIDSIVAGAEVGQATFRWRNSNSATWDATGVTTASTYVTLENGVRIKWASGTGDDFVVGDQWTIRAAAIYGLANLSSLNRDDVFRTNALDSPCWVKANLGSAENVKAVVILDHNFTSGATITLNAATIDELGDGSALTAAQEAWVVAHMVEDETGATGFKCSMLDGSAFFVADGLDLSGYVGKFLRLKDSTGKVAYGYISAAGGGETLGSEILTNPTFNVNTTGWTPDSCTLASIAGGQSGNCLEVTRTGGGSQLVTAITGINNQNKLLKITAYAKSGTSGNEEARIRLAGESPIEYFVTTGAWVQWSLFVTATKTYTNFIITKNTGTAGTMLFDEASLKQVTDCAATGVHIVSTHGGATRNWTYIESGFNPNDAAMTFDICAGDVWDDPDYSQALPWATEKIVYFLDQTYQWWWLDVTDAANPDGYIEASELYLGAGITPSIAVEEGPHRMIDLTVPEWNEREAYQAQITCYNTATKDALRGLIEGLRDDNRIRPFFFCTNYSSPSANTWLMELHSPQITVDQAGQDHFRVGLDLMEARKSDV